MKKTNISALLLAALLLIQLLCAPVSAVTAEPAADAQADAQTASDNSAEDAAAEADSVPEDQLLSSREQFSVAAKAALLIDLNTNRVVYEQDADERVYPKGTGYLTDLGMTGAIESVLGIRPEQSIETFLGGLPGRYQTPKGSCKMQGAVFTLNSATGLCEAVERLDIR